MKKKKEERRRRKKKNKIKIFAFNFLDCEEKSRDSEAIFHTWGKKILVKIKCK